MSVTLIRALFSALPSILLTVQPEVVTYFWRSRTGHGETDRVLWRIIAMTWESAAPPSVAMIIAGSLYHATPVRSAVHAFHAPMSDRPIAALARPPGAVLRAVDGQAVHRWAPAHAQLARQAPRAHAVARPRSHVVERLAVGPGGRYSPRGRRCRVPGARFLPGVARLIDGANEADSDI